MLNLPESLKGLTTYIVGYFEDRLLILDGEKGTVACRVCYQLSRTMPWLSEDWTIECSARTYLRMANLIAVRGKRGASMVGPCDYFGNLGQLEKYMYSFDVGLFPPTIQRVPLHHQEMVQLADFDRAFTTSVNARWISGKGDPLVIKEKNKEYALKEHHLRQSLFLHPGLLELDTAHVELQHFDPRGIDLSSFRARLVENSTPFLISAQPLPAKDYFRVVTYCYEEGYADWQVAEGSGLFIERHKFSQFMTPLTPFSKGFVVLARLKEESDKELEMVGIQIPFGYTLIIEEGCIHGDTTLSGLYMMGMTSDHTTMATADTVFLKNRATKENVRITIRTNEKDSQPIPMCDDYRGNWLLCRACPL